MSILALLFVDCPMIGVIGTNFTKKKKKKKPTPAVKFLDLIFRNNFFVFNFNKKCSR